MWNYKHEHDMCEQRASAKTTLTATTTTTKTDERTPAHGANDPTPTAVAKVVARGEAAETAAAAAQNGQASQAE